MDRKDEDKKWMCKNNFVRRGNQANWADIEKSYEHEEGWIVNSLNEDED